MTNSHDCYSSDTLLFVLNSTCGHIPVLRIKGMDNNNKLGILVRIIIIIIN